MESRRWNIFAVIYFGVLIIVLGLLALLREVWKYDVWFSFFVVRVSFGVSNDAQLHIFVLR
jgi:hypothetical protein